MLAKSRALNFIYGKKSNYDLDEVDKKVVQENLLEEIIIQNEKRGKILKAINNLKSDYSMVIYLNQIEGFSYYETSMIMGKTEKQVKNLLYCAKKKLKNDLKEQGITSYEKFVKLFIIILVITVNLSGLVYAVVKIYKYFNSKLILSYSQTLDNNESINVWIGSFKLAWEDLKENYFTGKIEFNNSDNMLNSDIDKDEFSTNDLNQSNYYILAQKSSNKLKEKIINDVKNKFNINVENNLENINFSSENSYFIYSMLYKKLDFINHFDRLEDDYFKKSNEKIKYFGIIVGSEEKLNDNVEIMFYNENDFAIKLKTIQEDEIVLYYKDEGDKSLKDVYNDVLLKANEYTENKVLEYGDIVKIPYIDINTVINYNELCQKSINSSNEYISNALQSVIFSLNNNGVNIYSDSSIKLNSFVDITDYKRFIFDNDFYIFIKEKNSDYPYFSLKVNDLDLMCK